MTLYPLFLFMRKLPVIILTFFLVLSCRSEPPATITPAEMDLLIETGSIENHDFSDITVSQMDPESAFYLALKAGRSGYGSYALLLARHAWQDGSGYIRRKAAELYVETAAAAGRWPDVEFASSLASAEYPEDYSFLRSAAEALYWQHKDDELPEVLRLLAEYPESSADDELYLFSAVSAYRRGASGWRELWLEMFTEVPSSGIIRRSWDYLSASEEDAFSQFPGYRALIEGKYLFSTGEYPEAEEALSGWLEDALTSDLDPEIYKAAAADLETLYVRLGRTAEGGGNFERYAGLPGKGDAGGNLRFAAARLYRRAGWYGSASRCLGSIIDDPDVELTDRILWYSLDVEGKRSPAGAVRNLQFYLDNWSDPFYFEDTLNSLCTALVRARLWKEIYAAALMLEAAGPDVVADRFFYIAGRASEAGLFRSAQAAPREWSDPYYSILMKKSVPGLAEGAEAEGPEDPPDYNAAERYIDGLLAWGLDDLVLDEIRENAAELSESFLAGCAGVSVGRGEYLDSIRIMYQYCGEYTEEGFRGLYPLVYSDEIMQSAGQNGIPPQLLLGLVWKESGFEADIVSRSGAVGLSQLMPSTAADVSSRLRTAVPDLTDPAANLAIGSWYLNWLLGYVGSASAAVISYNGGPGRVKRWMREYPDFPADLLYEAVPVHETHNYGKRVLTASVVYGMLYYDIAPETTLDIFFPNLPERG